jgi:hypothetical protein
LPKRDRVGNHHVSFVEPRKLLMMTELAANLSRR